MWVFTLCYGGEPSLDLTHTVNQDSLGCKVLNLRSNQYKPRRNLLAGGTGNSEGWGLLQALWMNILTLHRGGSLFPHVCTPVHWLHFLLPATRDDRWLLQTHECSYLRSEGFPFFRCLHQYPPCQTRSIDWPLLWRTHSWTYQGREWAVRGAVVGQSGSRAPYRQGKHGFSINSPVILSLLTQRALVKVLTLFWISQFGGGDATGTSGWRPGTLPNTLQDTGQPPTPKNYPAPNINSWQTQYSPVRL